MKKYDDALFTRAGPEIGVVTPKTFSSQVAMILLLADRVIEDIASVAVAGRAEILRALGRLPNVIQQNLNVSSTGAINDRYQNNEGYSFIGRGVADRIHRTIDKPRTLAQTMTVERPTHHPWPVSAPAARSGVDDKEPETRPDVRIIHRPHLPGQRVRPP